VACQCRAIGPGALRPGVKQWRSGEVCADGKAHRAPHYTVPNACRTCCRRSGRQPVSNFGPAPAACGTRPLCEWLYSPPLTDVNSGPCSQTALLLLPCTPIHPVECKTARTHAVGIAVAYYRCGVCCVATGTALHACTCIYSSTGAQLVRINQCASVDRNTAFPL
jgi:hypothetical protein